MPKPLFKTISLSTLISYVNDVKSFPELLGQIGYVQTNDQRVIKNISIYLEENNVDFTHLTLKEEDKLIVCKKCQKEKPLNEFYQSNNKIHYTCKECVKEEQKKIYHQKQDYLNSIKKQQKCKKCGNDKYYLIDFHHIDPKEKDFAISNRASMKLESILTEIKKCIPLCSNCHREFHFLEREYNISLDEYLNAEMGELVETSPLLRDQAP